MKFYDNYVIINKTPKETYRSHFQNVVNSFFSVTPTIHFDVEEEIEFGTMKFEKIDVRVNNLVDAKTGQRVNDDFKKIIFPDNTYEPVIGTRYRFDENIWIVFSTDNVKTDTASVYVRRCNNTLNFQDEYGNIYEEPCYIDYSLTETQIFKEYSMDIPRGRILVGCQLNKNTAWININERFLFNGDAYKVRVRDKLDRRETFDKNTARHLKLQLDYDNISEEDNLELNIANYKNYNYEILCNNVIGVAGNMGMLKPIIDFNCVNTSNIFFTFSFSSTNEEIATVDKKTGEYRLLKSGNCEFICVANENKSFIKKINVSVKKEYYNNYETIIEPRNRCIRIGEVVNYRIYETLNSVLTNTKFIIEIIDYDTDFCKIQINESGFIIKNIKPSDKKVKIKIKNMRNSEIKFLDLELRGLF